MGEKVDGDWSGVPVEDADADDGRSDEIAAIAAPAASVHSPNRLQALSAALGVDMGGVVNNIVPVVRGNSNTGGRNPIVETLIQGWENYMSDSADQPLQILEDLQLCGRQDLGRLTQDPATISHPLMQPTLRHSRSSPLQSRPSIFDQHTGCNEESDILPPPIPLDPMQRSSSTPSSFRQNSFSSSIGAGGRSAFTLPSQRVTYTSSVCSSKHSAFDPVKYYACQLEDMERTSIEVMDMAPEKQPEEEAKQETPPQRGGAAARAARFLSDVRVIARRRSRVFGRQRSTEQPTEATSDMDIEPEEQQGLDTSITVISEMEPNDNDSSMFVSKSPEFSAIVGGTMRNSSELYSSPINEMDVDNDDGDTITPSQYRQLDSEQMSEEHYQRIETQLEPESPSTIPSPSYQQFVDDRPVPTGSSSRQPYEHSLRIKFSSVDKQLETLPSPSPTRMAAGDVSETESPVTAQSSGGSSSGHTTQATSTASSIGQSGLSTISETDREVMEANKEAKRRRKTFLPEPVSRKHGSDLSIHSSSTNSSATHGYLPLGNSPVPLRDGAKIPVERFFNGSGATVRSQSSRSQQSGNTTSPSTTESASGTNTMSSTSSKESSSREGPLTFVSYLERLPELMSVREAAEPSSPRTTGSDGEEREDSPAPEMGDILFEEAKAPRESKLRVNCPETKKRIRLDKFRMLPPRSPYRTPRSASTPSPRASPIIHQHSPPRHLTDQPEQQTLMSRPNVTRTGNLIHPSASINQCMNDFEEEEEVAVLTHPKFALYGAGAFRREDTAMAIDEPACVDTSFEILHGDNSMEVTVTAASPIVSPAKPLP